MFPKDVPNHSFCIYFFSHKIWLAIASVVAQLSKADIKTSVALKSMGREEAAFLCTPHYSLDNTITSKFPLDHLCPFLSQFSFILVIGINYTANTCYLLQKRGNS